MSDVELGSEQKLRAPEQYAEEIVIRAFPTVASHIIDDGCSLDQRQDLLDLNIVRIHFYNEGRLSHAQAMKIIRDSNKILRKEPNLLRIDAQATIIGDIHGQFYDMLALLETFDLSRDVLLFLGDYVDRGVFSTEVYFYLLLLKSHYPNNIFLLRGNHESRRMTEYFTFKRECLHKYSGEVYEECLESFRSLPVAAVVLSKLYCSHGGISPRISKVEEINQISRFIEVERDTTICDILWSDPHPLYDKTVDSLEFVQNEARGCSVYYTYAGVTKFLRNNRLRCIVRGHEVKQGGHSIYLSYNGFPSVITVFSAPNYCDAYGNRGAVLRYDGSKLKIKTFAEQPHPYCLPNGMDGVNWSISFFSQKISELYLDLLREIANDGAAEEVSERDAALAFEMEKSQNFATSMALVRMERENLTELEDEESEMVSATGIKLCESQENEFMETREMDRVNEMVPPKDTPRGLSLEISPSAVPPITKEVGEIKLERLLDKGDVITLEDNDTMKMDIPDKEKLKEEDTFYCWCFR
jgi:serine/threonine-protein phosphatase 2B catalytic subunit